MKKLTQHIRSVLKTNNKREFVKCPPDPPGPIRVDIEGTIFIINKVTMVEMMKLRMVSVYTNNFQLILIDKMVGWENLYDHSGNEILFDEVLRDRKIEIVESLPIMAYDILCEAIGVK